MFEELINNMLYEKTKIIQYDINIQLFKDDGYFTF